MKASELTRVWNFKPANPDQFVPMTTMRFAVAAKQRYHLQLLVQAVRLGFPLGDVPAPALFHQGLHHEFHAQPEVRAEHVGHYRLGRVGLRRAPQSAEQPQKLRVVLMS
jgi:hypothetical protein